MCRLNFNRNLHSQKYFIFPLDKIQKLFNNLEWNTLCNDFYDFNFVCLFTQLRIFRAVQICNMENIIQICTRRTKIQKINNFNNKNHPVAVLHTSKWAVELRYIFTICFSLLVLKGPILNHTKSITYVWFNWVKCAISKKIKTNRSK